MSILVVSLWCCLLLTGWIIEWAIATEAKSRPSTRGLLSVGSSPRKDEVKQEERGEVDQKEQAAARDEDGLMEEKDITEEKPAVPMEPEEDVAKGKIYSEVSMLIFYVSHTIYVIFVC